MENVKFILKREKSRTEIRISRKLWLHFIRPSEYGGWREEGELIV